MDTDSHKIFVLSQILVRTVSYFGEHLFCVKSCHCLFLSLFLVQMCSVLDLGEDLFCGRSLVHKNKKRNYLYLMHLQLIFRDAIRQMTNENKNFEALAEAEGWHAGTSS